MSAPTLLTEQELELIEARVIGSWINFTTTDVRNRARNDANQLIDHIRALEDQLAELRRAATAGLCWSAMKARRLPSGVRLTIEIPHERWPNYLEQCAKLQQMSRG